MKIERINGERGYGVRAVFEEGDQIGYVSMHSQLTQTNPNVVELDLNRMESDLAQQLSELLVCLDEIK